MLQDFKISRDYFAQLFVLRFIKQLKRRQRLSSVLTSNELEYAELLLRQHQKEFFSSEQKLLHEN